MGRRSRQAKRRLPDFYGNIKKIRQRQLRRIFYKKDHKGNFILDERGRRILDNDLDEIAEVFIKFAKEQKFSFWK